MGSQRLWKLPVEFGLAAADSRARSAFQARTAARLTVSPTTPCLRVASPRSDHFRLAA